ncbi:MAG: hypothetical protein EBY35_14170 [Rhodobacteraceae bacterium]|nr:hypothetical protein [Paracoccaceae bacterium]
MTQAQWPARMQRLLSGRLVELAGNAELWLDGGHNPAAGEALAAHIATLPKKSTYLICGMLNTKDILGYLKPFSAHVDGLIGVSIPNEINTLSAEETVGKARAAGMHSMAAQTIGNAIQTVIQKDPNARILLCGSLYLAGEILRQNNQPKG